MDDSRDRAGCEAVAAARPDNDRLRAAFILSRRADLIWFLGLPFVAVGLALASQNWLPFVALASVNLWITAPHHFVTWLRTYGHREDRQRWKVQLFIAPVVIFALTLSGFFWAPLTFALLIGLWDHQHSIMQQYGFARIYDFKARSGAASTRTFDLILQWLLYGNLLINAPLFSMFWLRELDRWHVPMSVEGVRAFQATSWIVLGAFACVYVVHLLRSLACGDRVNPIKYAFLGASYFLWYFTAWHTHSLLVWGIAHRLMHGLQYIVIVYWFLRRKGDEPDARPDSAIRLARRGKLRMFLLACAGYAIGYQLLLGLPLETSVFGLIDFSDMYDSLPSYGLNSLDKRGAYDIFAATMIDAFAITHYYFDSFIWKVRNKDIQRGL